MAKRRKKTTKKRRKVVSSPGLVGLILLGVGLFYFFVTFYAPNSPFKYIWWLFEFLFGALGIKVFFGTLILLGISLILYPPNWKERIFLYSFIAFLTFLPILSFPLLNSVDSDTILKTGGYMGFGILKLWAFLMGNNIFSTKLFSIALFVIVAGFVFWKLNFYLLLPKIEIKVPDTKPERKKITIPVKKPEINLGKSSLKSNGEGKKTIDFNSTKENLVKNILKDTLKKEIKKQENQSIIISYPQDKPTFSADLLQGGDTSIQIDKNELLNKAQELQTKLAEFNIPVEIAGYEVGPTVIQFKIKPAQGVKVSSIEKLKKDLSLALKSTIRILAPIPGTEYVGVEMPNPNSKIVYLSELLKSNDFIKAMNNSLTNLAIGKTITGSLFLYPLEKMPHLLVAGQTGSGKSVAINDFIISLLYQNTPAELKFIMVDPKQVELGLYDGIPHLLAPIITEPEKALKALKWAVDVMNRRYKKLKDTKVRNIDEYNQKVDGNEKMSRIVIIIDELADLMMSGNKKEVEQNIARIAQMARAVGMHLILATQRPSVNVITGLIKANIPTRIAFGVVSQVDSRTILDRIGAEDLLGKGDLLFTSPNYKHPIRIQAPFVSTEDAEKVINEIKSKYLKDLSIETIYDQELIDTLEGNKAESAYSGGLAGDDEELIQQAIEIIQQTRKASITLLQRRLKIGFARAARLMDELEERGIVGPQEGSKPRDILI